ncbi:NUDIX hydrolase [Nocardioides sp. BYT-33-1]|uniref:NUDIX hydrolase n=1 Tax=Nocardioides sp. BYT-33-1 TaxID=3416952 RepID=UPI003F535A9E
MPEPQVITVSAVVIRDRTGAVLTVRKRGTDRFMLPGGKPEPGETPLQTAVRECHEELGAVLDPAELRLVGSFRAAAANEAGFEVAATVFEHPARVSVVPAAEIAELRWLPAGARPLPADLAPLLAEHVLPALDHLSAIAQADRP